MQNKNDKIVELIKAYLDGKTLQYSWCGDTCASLT
jgi:hypothetical protein